MKENIEKQISAVSQAIDWFRKYKAKGEYEQHFVQLVRERSSLRKILEAECENPAIAAFGESQQGKSYIMSSILQNGNKPFMIKAKNYPKGINFINEINPRTDNTEATGVVTRFSSFSQDESKYNENFPVLLKIFSVSDIITILCIGYFENIVDIIPVSDLEIENFAESVYEKYINKMTIDNTAIDEDDIFLLQDYMHKFLTAQSSSIHRSSYFNKLALVIKKIPISDYCNVFEILWNRNEQFSALFNRLLGAIQSLRFEREVYTPIETVLNDNNTLMSVECLNYLNPAENQKISADVIFKDQSKIAIDKGELCAVCAEVVYKIDQEYLDESLEYNKSGMDSSSAIKLPNGGVQKNILRSSDLLDFPGARREEKLRMNDLVKFDSIKDTLRRGKVSYLFNKYSESMAINSLLFCHSSGQNSVANMYILLGQWIQQYIGNTPEQRKRNIQLAGGVSPFFLVATMFNKDMRYVEGYRAHELNKRWDDRYCKVYFNECIKGNSPSGEWFSNWDNQGSSFSNTYLLRDYKFSSDKDGGANQLYTGYPAQESKMLLSNDYYNEIRRSFVENEWVKKFFADPQLSWDVAATLQNDGSLYLIQQLSIIAPNLRKIRDTQFSDKLRSITERVIGILNNYWTSDDESEALEENISKASRISFDLDHVNRTDPYFFGNLIELLQLSEKEVSHMMHKIIQGSELNQVVYGSNDYDAIKITCRGKGHDLDKAANDDEKWNCILKSYPHYSTKEQAEKDFEDKGINISDLFKGGEKPRLNSQYIAGQIYAIWENKLQSPKHLNDLIGDSKFDRAILGYITNNLISSFKSLGVDTELSNSIAEYVNTTKIESKSERFISALLASTLNRYILDFGYSIRARDIESIDKVKSVSEARQLNLFDRIDKPRENKNSEKELTDLLNCIGSQENSFTPSFERNYYSWKDYMFISLISQNKIVDPVDIEANNSIKTIMDFIRE